MIGIAAPLSGPNEILGRQIEAGAKRAAEENGGTTVSVDTFCSADGGREAANALIAARAAAAVGFLCTVALEAALPKLSAAAIPVLDVGVRAARIQRQRQQHGALVWRLAPAAGAEARALAGFVRERWSDTAFGIVEDGSPQSRDLADKVRQALEADGLRAAVTETYRPAEEKQFPVARRLQQSGVTRVLFLGARSDTAVILRDAAEIGSTLEAAGGESLIDAGGGVALPAGVVALASGFDVDWAPSETPPEDEGYARIARVGAEIAIQAGTRARAESRSVIDLLNDETFITTAGLVRFDGEGAADVAPFRAYRWDGQRFVPDAEG
ncbi:ABC transporter substrate-binding protein [Aureimonas phyllosphaerae]|uniref:ABC transporter substrate-binding protein n=1 Tax=Aureimonas phyllosphaerae TaxID=1166078 RepID=UPI003A5BA125